MANPNITVLTNTADLINRSATSISASSATAVANFPLTNTQHPHLEQSYRTNTLTVYLCGLIFDLGAATNFDSFMMLGTNLAGESGTVHFYCHTSNLGASRLSWQGTATKLGDNGSDVVPTVIGDHVYGYFASTQNKRYIAIFSEFTTHSDGYVEIGRVMVGMKTTFSHQYNDPLKYSHENTSFVSVSHGNQTFEVERDVLTLLGLPFDTPGNAIPRADWIKWRDIFKNEKRKPFGWHLREEITTSLDVDMFYLNIDTAILEQTFNPANINRVNQFLPLREHR